MPCSHPLRRRGSLLPAALVLLACGDGGGPTDPGSGNNRQPPEALRVASVVVGGVPAEPALVGSSFQLTAVARDARGASLERAVSWRSDDAAVAQVGASGLVTGAGLGRTTIRATSDGVEGQAAVDFRVGGSVGVDGGMLAVLGGAVTIALPAQALARPVVILIAPPASVPAEPRLAPGTMYEITPTGLSLDKPAVLRLQYDGASLPSGVTDVSLQLYRRSGDAWGVVPGSAVDLATRTVFGNVTQLGVYAVLGTPVDRLALSGEPPAGRLYVGETVQLAATPLDAADNALPGRGVVWSSSNPALSVDFAGRVRAWAPGSATITATSEGKTASVTLTVLPVPVARVTVTPATAALLAGNGVQLVAALHDAAGLSLTGRTVRWTSADPLVATVDGTGRVTAVAAGTATITATSEEASGTAAIRVVELTAADCTAATEWTTYQGNACHTGYVARTLDPASFRELWVATVAAGAALNPVTLGDGKVFVSTTSYFGTQLLSVRDARTGAETWRREFPGIHSVHPPAFGNGRVYVTTGGHGDSFLWSFDAGAGTVLFRSAYGNQWSRYYAPVVLDGGVFMAGGYYGGAYRFDAADGAQRWFRALNQYDEWTPAVSNGLAYAYTGSYSPKLSILSATTGDVLAEVPDPNFSWNGWSMNTAPVLGGAFNVLAIQGSRLLSFDVRNRRIAWEQTGTYVGTVTLANRVAYVLNNRQVEARRESDGSLLWVWVAPEGTPQGTMVATDNLLFVSTAARTYAIDLTSRREVWSYAAGGSLALSAQQQLLLIAQSNGKVAAIALQ